MNTNRLDSGDVRKHTAGAVETIQPFTLLARPFPAPDALSKRVSANEPISFPLADTRFGNLFRDHIVGNLFWYLPTFAPLTGADASFAFAATRSGVDAQGNAFNSASLTLSLQKVQPPDVLAARDQNPQATFREIPLTHLDVTLHTKFKDAQGNAQTGTYPGSALIQADGSVTVTFNALLGVAVIIAYENLTQTGEASLEFVGAYRAWRQMWWVVDVPSKYWARQQVFFRKLPDPPPDHQPEPIEEQKFALPPPVLQVPPVEGRPTTLVVAANLSAQVSALELVQSVAAESHLAQFKAEASSGLPLQTVMKSEPISLQEMLTGVRQRTDLNNGRDPGLGVDPGKKVDPPETEPPFVPLPYNMGATVALGQAYATSAYKLKYTLNDGAGTRTILSVGDLKDYNVRQSEFSELRVFGDIATKYPSFSRLYLGALSRTVVAIPARYGILCSVGGCAALCQALVDSSPGIANVSTFQFVFSLGPVVSPVDMLRLAQDIAAQPNLRGCQLQLPGRIDPALPQTLLTPFANTCAYANGISPHTFALAVVIKDVPGGALAVANANLFIQQLIRESEPYLTGSFGLKLDDYYDLPIPTTAVLSFNVTSGDEDLIYTIDQAQQTAALENRSALALQLTRYAVHTSTQLQIHPLANILASQKFMTLPLQSSATDPELLLAFDYQLALANPLTRADLHQYLALQAEDVQQVQYDFAINASNVNFQRRNISRISAQISLDPLPNIALPALTLMHDLLLATTRVVIPTLAAVSSLAATITFTVQFIDPHQNSTSFTRANDFIDHPIFVLLDSDLP